MCQVSTSKRMPLIVLHKSRVTGGPAQHPNNQRLLENWKKAGALYSTPQGSNDDWCVVSAFFFFSKNCNLFFPFGGSICNLSEIPSLLNIIETYLLLVVHQIHPTVMTFALFIFTYGIGACNIII